MSMNGQKKNWHRLAVDESLRQLGSGPRGLSAKEAARRLRKNGRNPLFDFSKKRDTVLRRLFTDPALLLFAFVAALSLCFSAFSVALTALVVFGLWLSFTVWKLLRMERCADALERCGIPTVRVLRNGKPLTVSAANVVVGDVVLLSVGDVAPADCRLVTAADLKVLFPYGNGKERNGATVQPKRAETVYPYQSEIDHPNCENLIYAGSEVLCGTAKAVVVAVGTETFCGTLGFPLRSNALEKDSEQINRLTPYFRLWGFASLILCFPVGIIALLIAPPSQSGMRVFLPVCAWVLTSSAILPYCYLRLILHHGISGLLQKDTDQNGALIKSTKAVDRLPRMTDLFLLGRCATSDGKVHFQSAFTGEGTVLPTQEPAVSELQGLCEAFCLLERGLSRLPQHLIDVGSSAEPYLAELILTSGYDREALEVRTVKTELFRGRSERILDVETTEGQFRLRFYSTQPALFGCGFYQKKDGLLGTFDGAKRSAYRDFCSEMTKSGCAVTTVVKEYRGTVSLVGCLATQEAFFADLAPTVASLEKDRVAVRLFLESEEPSDLAYAATCMPREGIARASELSELSDAPANCRVFLGYSPKQIREYLIRLKKQGRVIGAVSCDFGDRSVLSAASVSIGCDFISSDDGSDSRCVPLLQRDSDVLISRASRRGGGICAVKSAVLTVKQCCGAVASFFQRFFAVRVIQATVTVVSILTGMGSMPPYAILFGALFLDVLLLFGALDEAERSLSDGRLRISAERIWKQKRFWLLSAAVPAIFTLTLGIVYRLKLLPLEVCYAVALFGMMLLSTLAVTVGNRRLKITQRTVRGVLILWIPTLILLILSFAVPGVATLTELGWYR